ncbi:acyl-CoA dehydrogenase [Pseudomaricurvus alkylphenolicus]|uniref:acyl-CoA dehydrogenase C-terminal domain-containing protein n=1 Tax=Pseudomaricurvus alkylphenolicus TaxID=1306991 RepID=UPI001421566D|nr:acyl-CoA dehydrogenase C-terminal domain-containing protein [Pseudomaricurvus alkylphenolicus]NIB41063.1 acyl-CoA dehydrogenase [Pseudomaricurvus alkylphenolicus]
MTNYKAPMRDIRFAMKEVLGFDTHYASLPGGEDASPEMVDAILDEFAKFCENALVPINRSGDEEGCHWNDGVVNTPHGFKEAYRLYADGGWASVTGAADYGGQGLPSSLGRVLSEMLTAANTGFALYTAGQSGAIETLAEFGTHEQRSLYERKLIDGSWNATMCLTEPHCGTDLGLLRTKAEPNQDGSYNITGTKIFITGGEHDLTENIVHIVLARLPDAPEGTKGISLFIVPKYLCDDGNLRERNSVRCGSIEHKMGIKASATCVMNFDGAKGYLLGESNRGLMAMFTFMNASRIAAATQGVAHAELGFQKSLAYARERLQMRAPTGPQNPNGPADPIIVHPDVRRMLLTQKAFAEGNRLLIYYLSQQLDLAERGNDEATRNAAKSQLDFLTPIAKAFASETGFEAANQGLQCFGGHGYIREWGMEQNVRDARIAMLYEGTTGVQALDLLGRKVLGAGLITLQTFINQIDVFCDLEAEHQTLGPLLAKLRELTTEWQTMTLNIGERARSNPEEVGAASVNYLMYCGYVCLAYLWAQSAAVAARKLESGTAEPEFYRSKILTAQFYFNHLLPRTRTCVQVINAGAESLMTLSAEHFQF